MRWNSSRLSSIGSARSSRKGEPGRDCSMRMGWTAMARPSQSCVTLFLLFFDARFGLMWEGEGVKGSFRASNVLKHHRAL